MNSTVYQEHESTFESDGTMYDLNRIFRQTHGDTVHTIDLDKLVWVLKFVKGYDPERVQRSDVDVPILVAKVDGRMLVVDGLHRLIKARNSGATTMRCIYVSDSVMRGSIIKPISEATMTASITPQKRKEVQLKILKTLAMLDPSLKNAKKYELVFSKMSDKQFLDYFKKMASSDNNNFYVEMDLYSDKKVSMDSIEASAAYLKLPLEEHVYINHTSPDGSPVRSPFKVPVMYIHLKSNSAPLFQ